MKRYGLLGAKLSHSWSPVIHKEIFHYLKVDATYELFEKAKEELPEMIKALKEGKYDGFNVTIPYKKEIMKYLDDISEEAKVIGSVNTIVNVDGKAVGYNTDYYGFYNELLYYKVEVSGKNCYVLGTGGASLAIHKALVDLGGNVGYVSRQKKDNAITYEELAGKNIDVLVNTTPVGMYPQVGVSPVDKKIAKKAKYVIDIIFNPRRTQLLMDADSHMNGLYMLVGQAIKAEELWQKKEIKMDVLKIMEKIR